MRKVAVGRVLGVWGRLRVCFGDGKGKDKDKVELNDN